MIRYLQVDNFKSLKNIAIPLEKLNLFFGMNGMGKSSVLQALLLLRQSYWSHSPKWLGSLKTRGGLINLGTSTDVFCQGAEVEYIHFLLGFKKDRTLDLVYDYGSGLKPIGILRLVGGYGHMDPSIEQEPLFANGFSYLGAEHIGPRNEYSADRWEKEGLNPMGNHGEFAVPFLALEGETYRVPAELCLDSGKTDRLLDQVSAWMSVISPGIKIGARYLPTEEAAKLDIRYNGARLASDPFLPVNVGFGVPYVLPLIVTLLTATPDSLLLLENPESHLHPRGQSGIADLIARAAAYGTQILCESHSDHIINGIRVAVKEGTLSCQDLSVVYFDKDEEQMTKTTEIAVDRNGNLSEYPDGLLDEWGILMSALI